MKLWLLGVLVVIMLTTSTKVLGYIQGKAVELDLVSIGGNFFLRRDAANSLRDMSTDAIKDGVALVINSAFRSMAEQEGLVVTRPGLAAKPGYSPHQAGIAVDFETANGTNTAYAWLRKNAGSFGWFQTVVKEPWHWEYRAV